MPAIPPPPPGFTLDVPPPPAGFKLDSESSVPPPPPGFKLDDEPNFADVVGGSSTATPPAPLGEQFKQSFVDAGRNIKKYAWDIPTEVLDRPLKPIRESLQQGGITGEMLPDIAKQNFGRFAGGAAAGLERDVAPGLMSGENAAMAGAMAANPVLGAALLSKFGGEGAKQAIAATQAPPNETPEEKGRRFAQGLGGAAMAVAPLAHVGSRFVREAVKPEPLDMSTIRPEDLGAESRVPDTATAEGTPNVANARKAEAVAALEKFKEELPPVEEPKPLVPPDKGPGYIAPDVLAAQPFDIDPAQPTIFNRWVDENAPPGGYREIQDAAAGHAEKPTDVEIQEAARQLDKLDRAAAEGQPAEAAAAGDNGEAGATAVGSLGNAPWPEAEWPAGEAARGPRPAEDGSTEAGNPRDVQRPAEAGQAAPGAEGVPVENPQHTQATIRDFQKQADRPMQEESRFKRGWDETLDAARANNDPLLARALGAQPGERLSDEVRAAGFQRLREMAADPKPEDAAAFDKLSSVLYEAGSELGRGLNFSKALLDRGNIADPAAVIDTAMKATQGKLSVQAKLDLADMSRKAGEMKARSEESINKRAEAALARLEGMGEQIKKLTIKDVIGCR